MPYRPLSDYGLAKAHAEQSLLMIDGLEVVIARPCLVYGSGAPGNFKALMQLCRLPIPLPFGCARNKRSLLSVTNAVRALEFLALADGNKVAGKIFHVAEPVPFSTARIVSQCRLASGRAVRLANIPGFLMKIMLSLCGKKGLYEQLFSDLEVDTSSLIVAGFEYEEGISDLRAMAIGAKSHGRLTANVRDLGVQVASLHH
jgi:UDP-glucose 4-epimerase